MNGLDYILSGLILFSFWRGWVKGILRTLLGPFIFFLCVVYAYLYYQRTKNFLLSLGIGLAGPIVLNVIVWMFFAVFNKGPRSRDKDKTKHPFDVLNRFAGGIFSACWTVLVIGSGLIFFAVIPIRIPGLEGVRRLVTSSESFSMIRSSTEKYISFPPENVVPVDLENNQEYVQRMQETPEYQDLMRDQRVKAVSDDPRIREKVQSKDIVGLFYEPRIQELMKDPNLIRKFFDFHRSMQELNQGPEQGAHHEDDI